MAGLAVSACRRAGCDRGDEPHYASDAGREIEVREVDFDSPALGAQKAVVVVPRWGGPTQRYPLLIALHGRGESNQGLRVGAWGWVHDYWLDRAIMNLRRPSLDSASLLGLTDESQLQRLNGSLAATPFRGLVIACPYTPDILSEPSLAAAEPFAQFVQDALLPRMRAEFPVDPARSATGIDGVSLGGRLALLTAWARPRLFGAVGTLQAAIRGSEIAALVERARKAMPHAEGPLPVRLLTSQGDPFRLPLQALANGMQEAGLTVTYQVVPGPHDYEFNRGPGGHEMLLWHDRVLRGEAAP